MNDDRPARLAEQFDVHIAGCEWLGSPFYAGLLRRLEAELGRAGAFTGLLAPYAASPWEDAVPLRMLGAVHRLVLRGDAPGLARHFPSTGGDGDADACVAPLLALVEDRRAFVADVMTRPPQTNEVGRSAALAGGFCWIARETKRPLATLELGASAGLNSRWDRYRYEQDAVAFGPAASPLRFTSLWNAPPPFDTEVRVVARHGCDRDPIDATTPDGRIALLSYVWPDQTERLERLRGALAVAREAPMTVDAAAVAEWLPARLAQRRDDATTVVFHSIVWQYLDAGTRASVRSSLAAAAAANDAPLVWLRLEPDEPTYDVTLRATVWPGGTEHHLANATPHLGPVEWLVP